MLSSLDPTKRELLRIKKKLESYTPPSLEPLPPQPSQYILLRGLAQDLLKRFYADSPNSQSFLNRITILPGQEGYIPPTELAYILDDAIAASPPVWRAFEDDTDRRYVQNIVDAAVLKSRVTRYVGLVLIALALFCIALLGFKVSQLSSYTDEAVKLVEDAEANFFKQQEKIAAAEENARSILDDTNALNLKLKKREEELSATLALLDDPHSAYANAFRSLEAERATLSNLRDVWVKERQAWAAKMEEHQVFFESEQRQAQTQFEDIVANLTEKSGMALGKVESTRRNAEDKIAADIARASAAALLVDETLNSAKESRMKIDALLDTTRAQSIVLVEEITDARANVREAATFAQTATNIGKEAEQARDAALQARDVAQSAADAAPTNAFFDSKEKQRQLDFSRAVNQAEASKTALDEEILAWQQKKLGFDNFIDEQSTLVENDRDNALEKIRRASVEPELELIRIKTRANDKVALIEEDVSQAEKRLNRVEEIALKIRGPESELLDNLQKLESDVVKLRGDLQKIDLEAKNVTGIIALVEDKRIDVEQKLEQLLAVRPSLDFATAKKVVLSNTLLKALIIIIAIMVLLIMAAILIPRRRVG